MREAVVPALEARSVSGLALGLVLGLWVSGRWVSGLESQSVSGMESVRSVSAPEPDPGLAAAGHAILVLFAG